MNDARLILAGRHAAVTGGGRGIGRAVADALARAGASLTLMGRNRDALDAAAAQLHEQYGATVGVAECDVTSEESIGAAFEHARGGIGDPHILINNAGIAESARFVDTDRQLWDRTLATDLTGVFLCTRQVLPAMLEARFGRIVNIASTAGLRGYNRMAAYCAAKHGVVGLTRALAQETARHGITVNAVCPAYTDTDMSTAAVRNLVGAGRSEDEARAMLTRTIARGELIRPEEVAALVVWLCSDVASAVTGQAIAAAGGEV